VSANLQPSQEPNILGKFASVIGLLGAALFFTGWIYRWAYFSFFQLEVTTLDLPTESFLLVPLQVFLGNGWAIAKSAIALFSAIILIYVSLWLIQTLGSAVAARLADWQLQILGYYSTKRRKSWWDQNIESLAKFNAINFDSIKFLRSLIDETVIVAWVLIILFWFARWQGEADARRDAVNDTSSLPVVTFIAPENHLAIGRKLDDLLSNPSIKGYKIIGDKGLFDDLRGQETNDTSDDQKPRVWRLLMERGGWIYLFPALNSDAKPSQRPSILAIQESQQGEQQLILSPNYTDYTKKRSP